MFDTWFISDHHFQHKKSLTWLDEHGMLVRPEFNDVEEMDQCMVDWHNEEVAPDDHIWFLGDVTWKFNGKAEKTIKSLNGHKHLVVGNHDDIMWLSPYFESVHLWKRFEEFGFMASHVPLREEDMVRTAFNVHGHLHEKSVLLPSGIEDHRYMNVGVEQMGYRPVHVDNVRLFFGLG